MVPWFYNHKAGLEASRKILIFHEKLFIFKSPLKLFKKFPGKYRFPTETLSREESPLKTVNLNLHFLDNKLNINYIYLVSQLSRFLFLFLSIYPYLSLSLSINPYLIPHLIPYFPLFYVLFTYLSFLIYLVISAYLSLYIPLYISNLTNKKRPIYLSLYKNRYTHIRRYTYIDLYLYIFISLYL